MWSLKRIIYWSVRVIVFIVYGVIAPYAFYFGVRFSCQPPIEFTCENESLDFFVDIIQRVLIFHFIARIVSWFAKFARDFIEDIRDAYKVYKLEQAINNAEQEVNDIVDHVNQLQQQHDQIQQELNLILAHANHLLQQHQGQNVAFAG